MKLYQK